MPSASASTAVLDRRPSTLPFADLRKLELAKAIARHPQVVLVDEPFAGLTRAETEQFSDLIRTFRDEGRAVLLVDHNVKSVSALADRVVAMYLGERIAVGTADEVMRDETVRRVYLGGAITTAARPESAFADADTPLLRVEDLSVFYGKAQALEAVSIHVHEREFVSVVGLNGAGKTTLFNAVSGLVPYSGEVAWGGQSLDGRSAAADRQRRDRALPGNARAVRRHERAREPRPRRPAPDATRNGPSSSMAVRAVPAPAGAAKARTRPRFRAASSRCWRSRGR